MSQSNEAKERNARSAQNTPIPWDSQTRDRPRSRESNNRESQADSGELKSRNKDRESREIHQRERVERYNPRRQHSRDGSGGTGVASSNDYGEPQNGNGGRRHDYDVQSMESAISSPRASITKNPIPAPTVTVRSEFPTLSRSRQQQSLTCLVTIEVPEGKWNPDPSDIRGAPVLPSVQQGSDTYSNSRPKSPTQARPVEWPFESSEVLEEITEDLRIRVDNWHGLDFQRYVSFLRFPVVACCSVIDDVRFGRLRLYGTVRVGKDRQSWQELECFLFAEMLICVKEKKGAPPQYADGNSKRKLTRCTLKGSILIKKHLKHVESNPGLCIQCTYKKPY